MEITDIHPSKMKWSNSVLWAIIPLFYLVGAIGMQSAYRNIFLDLTPYLLIASSAILFIFRKDKRTEFSWFTLTCVFSGFLIEVAGVNSGLIFGKYEYGETLGPKIFQTPIVIGLNWFLISVACGAITELWTTRSIPKIVTASLLAVVFDFMIEPTAISLGYWSWDEGLPGTMNYLGWFGFSVFIQIVALFFDIRFKSTVAIVLFFSNFLFFSLLSAFG